MASSQEFDKPAATGPCAECGVPRELHDDPKQYIAPPSSQSTVTLDRAIGNVTHIEHWYRNGQRGPFPIAAFLEIRDALALLRAAETQPKQD